MLLVSDQICNIMSGQNRDLKRGDVPSSDGTLLEPLFPLVNGQFNFLVSVKVLSGLADMSLPTTDDCLMRRRVLERVLCKHLENPVINYRYVDPHFVVMGLSGSDT